MDNIHSAERKEILKPFGITICLVCTIILFRECFLRAKCKGQTQHGQMSLFKQLCQLLENSILGEHAPETRLASWNLPARVKWRSPWVWRSCSQIQASACQEVKYLLRCLLGPIGASLCLHFLNMKRG